MTVDQARNRIVIPLDVDTEASFRKILEELAGHVGLFKIGLQVIHAPWGGPRALEIAREYETRVFWDAKLHDIPNTVAGAAASIASLNVEMFNVMAEAGPEAMVLAANNAGNSLLLAVTILTSHDDQSCQRIYGASVKEKVTELALDACACGVDGLICSAKDLDFLSKYDELDGLLKVTPGIRPLWSAPNDQKRITTPAQAIAAGATHLVIGRPITKPPSEIGSPANAAKLVAEEIAEAITTA